jgi:hypothetical protein
LWGLAAILVVPGSGYRSFTGRLKGTDFIQFYTLGHLARSGEYGRLYDFAALHKTQEQLVPASVPEWYPPVYPPQAAILFAPFARWSYGTAASLWALCNVAVYAAIIWITWQRFRSSLPDGRFVAVAAAAFPPFWNLVLHGQTTIVLILAFFLGWVCLERKRRVLAGMAFGLLAIKPQYGIVLAAVVLARREWPILGGALLSIAGQVAAVCLLFDASVVWTYLRILPRLPDLGLLGLHRMHSLRSLTGLLPSPISTLLWSVAALGIAWQTVRTWRPDVPATARLAVLVLGTVLVSPHTGIYDATLLVLPLLWIAGLVSAGALGDLDRTFWPVVYWLFVAFLVPTAPFLGVQASVLLLVLLFVLMWQQFNRPAQFGWFQRARLDTA